jgi:hypothetical protein
MGVPVVSSLGLPKWRPEAAGWPRCWLITPRGRYFGASADVFDREYTRQLERFGARRIARELHAIGRGAERVVVLCFRGRPPDVPPRTVGRLVAAQHRRTDRRPDRRRT